jgi:hypothetical protein
MKKMTHAQFAKAVDQHLDHIEPALDRIAKRLGIGQPATVKREGTDASGAPYSISITVGGLSINGLELPSAMAAEFIADSVEGAIKKKRGKKKGAPK